MSSLTSGHRFWTNARHHRAIKVSGTFDLKQRWRQDTGWPTPRNKKILPCGVFVYLSVALNNTSRAQDIYHSTFNPFRCWYFLIMWNLKARFCLDFCINWKLDISLRRGTKCTRVEWPGLRSVWQNKAGFSFNFLLIQASDWFWSLP